jgi:hypothetical protein
MEDLSVPPALDATPCFDDPCATPVDANIPPAPDVQVASLDGGTKPVTDLVQQPLDVVAPAPDASAMVDQAPSADTAPAPDSTVSVDQPPTVDTAPLSDSDVTVDQAPALDHKVKPDKLTSVKLDGIMIEKDWGICGDDPCGICADDLCGCIDRPQR